jgi:hypothetical protein
MGLAYRNALRFRTIDGRPIAPGSQLVAIPTVPTTDTVQIPLLMRLATCTPKGYPQYILVFSVGERSPTPEDFEMFGPLLVGGPYCECDAVCDNLHNFADHFADRFGHVTGSRLVYIRDSDIDAPGIYEVVSICEDVHVSGDFSFRAGNGATITVSAM